MTIALFMMLLMAFATIGALLTEAIKKGYDNAGKPYSANIIALINAAVLGCGGTIVAYLLMAIPFTAANIAFIPIMVGAVWIGSMIGYDKVVQLVTQVIALKSEKKEEEKIEE